MCDVSTSKRVQMEWQLLNLEGSMCIMPELLKFRNIILDCSLNVAAFKKTSIRHPPLCFGDARHQDVLSSFPDVFLTPKPNTRRHLSFPAFFRRLKSLAVLACVVPVKGQISLPADSAYHHLVDGWLDHEPTSL